MHSHQTSLFTFNEVQVSYHTKELGPRIENSREAFEFLSDRWPNVDYCERMYVLMVNRNNHILGVAFISEGSVGGTVADPKKIFQIALKANASGILVAHNHPSGNLRPSQNDIKLTKKLKEAGLLLDLPLMDHIIITSKSYTSLSDEGLI